MSICQIEIRSCLSCVQPVSIALSYRDQIARLPLPVSCPHARRLNPSHLDTAAPCYRKHTEQLRYLRACYSTLPGSELMPHCASRGRDSSRARKRHDPSRHIGIPSARQHLHSSAEADNASACHVAARRADNRRSATRISLASIWRLMPAQRHHHEPRIEELAYCFAVC